MKQGIRKYLNEQVKFLEGRTPVRIPRTSEKEVVVWLKENSVGCVWELAGHYWFADDADASAFILYWTTND